MELKLQNGEYAPDSMGGFQRLTGKAALLQRVLFRLTARRGAFPLMPEMGSRMHLVLKESPSVREMAAARYAAEALADEPVEVTGATLKDIGGGRAEVRVYLDSAEGGVEAGLVV